MKLTKNKVMECVEEGVKQQVKKKKNVIVSDDENDENEAQERVYNEINKLKSFQNDRYRLTVEFLES